MTPHDWSIAVMAASCAAVAIAIVVVARRTLPLLRRMTAAVAELRATLERVQRIATEAEAVARDARVTEARVATTVNGLLDQVEPPIRTLTAALAGVRAGVGRLFEGDRPPAGNGRPGSRT